MQKNKCHEFSYWYSLLANVYHACNLLRNVDDPTKSLCMFLELVRFLSLKADCFGITVNECMLNKIPKLIFFIIK